MARRYVRDARGRFASSSYQGQTSGRGSRLRTPGKTPQRGSTIRASGPANTIGKSSRLKGAAGKITGTGNGATARGGRLRTAGGSLRATQTARVTGGTGRPGGTVKGRKSLAVTKELARMSKQVKRWKGMEFEPPSAKNNFQSRGMAARAALANIEPRYRKLKRMEAENSLNRRLAASRANKAFERQRSVNSGELSGKKTKFRSAAGARARYSGRVQDLLSSSKSYGELKRSRGMKRTVIGEQFNLLGRSTPIKSNRKTASNFNPSTYKVRRRSRGRLANR